MAQPPGERPDRPEADEPAPPPKPPATTGPQPATTDPEPAATGPQPATTGSQPAAAGADAGAGAAAGVPADTGAVAAGGAPAGGAAAPDRGPAADADATGVFPGAREQGPPPAADPPGRIGPDAATIFGTGQPAADPWSAAGAARADTGPGWAPFAPGTSTPTGEQGAVPPGSPPPHGAAPHPDRPPHPGQPHPGQPYPGQPYPVGAQQWAVTPEKRSRRSALWVTITLVLALLLCGGGGLSAFLLLRNAENGDGAPDPATAVNRFLTAVYTEKDPQAAAGLVCREARDNKQITAKVDEVRNYAKQYDQPRFKWGDPTVAGLDEDRAKVSVKITMTTEDEKTSEQSLTFTTIRKTGWWVCEVSG
jgi:hypothetical protein